jgi:ABC-2 type transport system ATP-binding protein
VRNDIAVKVRDLAKSYGSREAARGVSLEAPRGISYGLLGPNGGKTTTIKMLIGLAR